MASDQFLRRACDDGRPPCWKLDRRCMRRTRKSGRRVTRSMHMTRQVEVTGIVDQSRFNRAYRALLAMNGGVEPGWLTRDMIAPSSASELRFEYRQPGLARP